MSRDIKRRELLALPQRKWDSESEYDSLWLVPTGRKHDSGWSLIAIVGSNADKPIEIAAQCDDIEWVAPDAERFGEGGRFVIGQIRMDCAFPSGILHAWSYRNRFHVGTSLSSTKITVVERLEKS